MPVTLRQLRYLQALAETGSFGAAAERMSVSQPALSMQMKELETGLGTTLVERRAGGVRLTGAGKDVLRRALSILSDVADLEDAAQRGALGTELRLGMIPTVAPYLLPHLGGQSGVPVMLRGMALTEAPGAILLNDLREGRIDAAVISLPESSADLHTLQLFEDPLFLAGQSQHPALTGESMPDLHELLTLGPDHCLTDHTLTAIDLPHKATANAASLSSLCRLAGQGLGVTVIPQIAVQTEQAVAGNLAIRPMPQATRRIGLARIATDQSEMWFSELAHILSQAGKAALAAFKPRSIEKRAS